MRKALLVLGIGFLSSMANGQYMTKEEILKEYHSQKAQESFVFKAGPKFAENMKKTIPEDQFKPKTMAKVNKTEGLVKALNIPESVDLRGRDTSIKNQGATSLCTAYAGVAIIENMINQNGNNVGLDLSEYHAFSYYNVYQMDRFVSTISKNKICDEQYFPEGGKKKTGCDSNKHAMILNPVQIDQSQVLQTLANGNPVYFGMAIPRGFANCEKVVTDLTVTNGGHAIVIVGFIKDKTTGNIIYIIKNSWGAGCGDKGYVYMDASYCKKTWCYFYDFNKVTSKYDGVVPTPTITPMPTITPTPVPTVTPKTCTKWKVIWYAPWSRKCASYN